MLTIEGEIRNCLRSAVEALNEAQGSPRNAKELGEFADFLMTFKPKTMRNNRPRALPSIQDHIRRIESPTRKERREVARANG